MDAMKFLSEAKRMCNNAGPCETCDANEFCGFSPEFPKDFGTVDQMQKMVKIVEKWAEEHPCKTRQSEFLKQWPAEKLDKHGVLAILPCLMNSIQYKKPEDTCAGMRCMDCRKEFWGQEVE